MGRDKPSSSAMHRTLLITAFLFLLNAALSLAGGLLIGKGDPREVFDDIQQGIAAGNVSLFSSHFHTQVHVTLRGGESGLYSANQAYYLLQNYFRDRKPASFAFTTFGESDTNPYATGSLAFNMRGSRGHAQVYAALSHNGERWVVTHMNIY
ncbi:MAG: DUF4783 domain-containing protein [Bacteroidota bacterium]